MSGLEDIFTIKGPKYASVHLKLNILNLTSADEGCYFCKATGVNETSATSPCALLAVHKKPGETARETSHETAFSSQL